MTIWVVGGIYLALFPLAWQWIHGGGHASGTLPGLGQVPVLPLFGEARLWVACLLLALPLAFLTAGRWKVVSWQGVSGAVLAGLALPWILLEGLALLEPLWSFTGTDFALRLVARAIAAWLMLLPWLLAGASVARNQEVSKIGDWPVLVAFALLAILPAALYAARLSHLQREKLERQLERQLAVPALESIAILGQLTGWDGDDSERYVSAKIKLLKAAEQSARLANRPLADDAPAGQKWERAIAWVRLGQAERAQALLDPLAATDAVAALFAASLDRFEGRWQSAQTRYDALLNRPAGVYPPEDRYAIYEGLAEALQGLGRFAELSALWEQALVEFPGKAGTIRFNRAMAEASRGRYRQALADLDAAQKASPAMKDQVEKQRRRILANTSACMIGSS